MAEWQTLVVNLTLKRNSFKTNRRKSTYQIRVGSNPTTTFKIIRKYMKTIASDIVDNPNEIDWEQRRYELAKSILSGIVSRPPSIQIKEGCAVAIEMADEMIKQLKEGETIK